MLTTSSTAALIASATATSPASATAFAKRNKSCFRCRLKTIRWYATGGQQRSRERGQEEISDVETVLLGIERGEQRRERHREQEAEEHLHAEARHAQLPEQLDEVAVEALGLGLVSAVHGRAHRQWLLGRHGTLCTPPSGAGSVRRSAEPRGVR